MELMFYEVNNIKRVLILILLSVSLNTQVFAGTAWNQLVSNFANEFVTAEVQERRVFVYPISDLSKDQVYLPFADRIGSSIVSSLVTSGIQITNNPVDAELYLDIGFYRTPEGLSIQGSILNQDGIEIVNNSSMLTSEVLPKSWNKRTLKNISYEIAGKIDEKLAGQTLNILLVGLSGGESKSESFISDFTVAMNRYMTEELNSLPTIVIKKGSDDTKYLYKLKGKFRVDGNKIHLNYVLTKHSNQSIVATASTEFTMSSSVPQGMSMYPSNRSVAKDTFDNIDTSEGGISVAAWVNHANAVYRDGDRLEVSIRPDVDAYIRVFYVTADGTICQIKPISEEDSGLLSAGTIHIIGGKTDNNLEALIITDETIGQETIKIFASLTPIEERFLPIKRVRGVDYACTDDDYKSLKIGMAKALQKKRNIHPVNEIKILVK
jgi:hypothetical protein